MTASTPRIDNTSKNYFINGAMDFSQRIGLSTKNVSGVSAYIMDRFKSTLIGSWSAEPPMQRVSVDISNYPKIKNAMQISGESANDNTASISHEQRIESIFAKDLSENIISLSFLYNESEFLEADIDLYVADSVDDFSSVTQIGSTITLPIINDSTWRKQFLENISIPTSAKNGLSVKFTLKNPENTGVAITSLLTGFKLNIGKNAQNFSYFGRDYLDELSACQRYMEKSYDLDDAVGSDAGRNGCADSWSCDPTDGSRISAHVNFKTQKRIPPTPDPIYSAANGTPNQIAKYNSGSSSSGTISSYGWIMSERGISGYLDTNASFSAGNLLQWHWKVECEL